MQRIVIYSKHIRNVSGVQTFELAFLQTFYRYFDISFVYDIGDGDRIKKFSEYATMIRNEGQEIEGDICLYSSIFHSEHNIKAKKYIQVIHADLKHWGIDYNSKGVDIHVAVSDTIKEAMKRDFNVESVTIENLLIQPEVKPLLRFMTASRIANGKGFDRVEILVEKLIEHGLPFTFEIYGSGISIHEQLVKDRLKIYSPVKFMGERSNIHSYMNASDYVVQLSDSEGFCYSVYEALQVKTPVIVSRWDGVEKVVEDGVNGFILEKDMSNLDIPKLYEAKLDIEPPVNYNKQNQWLKILNS